MKSIYRRIACGACALATATTAALGGTAWIGFSAFIATDTPDAVSVVIQVPINALSGESTTLGPFIGSEQVPVATAMNTGQVLVLYDAASGKVVDLFVGANIQPGD